METINQLSELALRVSGRYDFDDLNLRSETSVVAGSNKIITGARKAVALDEPDTDTRAASYCNILIGQPHISRALGLALNIRRPAPVPANVFLDGRASLVSDGNAPPSVDYRPTVAKYPLVYVLDYYDAGDKIYRFRSTLDSNDFFTLNPAAGTRGGWADKLGVVGKLEEESTPVVGNKVKLVNTTFPFTAVARTIAQSSDCFNILRNTGNDGYFGGLISDQEKVAVFIGALVLSTF